MASVQSKVSSWTVVNTTTNRKFKGDILADVRPIKVSSLYAKVIATQAHQDQQRAAKTSSNQAIMAANYKDYEGTLASERNHLHMLRCLVREAQRYRHQLGFSPQSSRSGLSASDVSKEVERRMNGAEDARFYVQSLSLIAGSKLFHA